MHLTRESEYALRGLAFLASCAPGAVVSHADIADAQSLPATFLAKILQKLTRHGLLTSERGRGRGYLLARPPADITIREILEAVEGPRLQERCILWKGHCATENPCPLHYRMKEFVPELAWILEHITLAEYVAELGELAHHGPATEGAGAGAGSFEHPVDASVVQRSPTTVGLSSL